MKCATEKSIDERRPAMKNVKESKGENIDITKETNLVKETVTEIKPTIVKVYFPKENMRFDYYNECFELKEGDVVYVEGAYENTPGIVEEVITHFKVKKDIYKKVLKKLELEFHGEFKAIPGYMLCNRPDAITYEQFYTWFNKKTEDGEDEYLTGESGYVELDKLGEEDYIDYKIFQRGLECFQEMKIVCLQIKEGKGHAVVEGSYDNFYTIEFEYEDGVISGMFCDCPYSSFCKHEVNVCILFDVMRKADEGKRPEDMQNFVIIRRDVFFRILNYDASGIRV